MNTLFSSNHLFYCFVVCLLSVFLSIDHGLNAEILPRLDPVACKYGYINKEGIWIIQPQFEEAKPFEKGFAIVQKNLKQGVIDTSGKFIHEDLYWQVNRLCKEGNCNGYRQYFRVYPNGVKEAHSIMDSEGNIYFPDGLRNSERFNEFGYNRIEGAGGYKGYMHVSGDTWFADAEITWPFNNSSSPQFFQGKISQPLAMVKTGGKYGILREGFEWHMYPVYDSIIMHPLDRFIAWKEGRAAIFNKHGYQMTPHAYENIRGFSPDGLAVAEVLNRSGVITSQGIIMVPFIHDSITQFNPYGVAVYQSINRKWGLVNNEGDYITPAIYDSVLVRSDCYSCFQRGNYRQYSEKSADEDEKNFIISYKDGLAGLYRGDGVQLAETRYNSAGSTYIMPVFMKNDNKIHIYQPGGKVEDLSTITDFRNQGFAVKFGWLFNEEGTLLFPDSVRVKRVSGNYLVISSNNRYGIVTLDSEEILPLDYQCITDFSEEGYAYICQSNNLGVINRQGEFIMEAKYNKISEYVQEMKGFWAAEASNKKNINNKWIKRIEWNFFSVKDNSIVKVGLDEPVINIAKDSLAVIKKEGKYGLMDHKFNIILGPKYELIVPNPNQTYWMKADKNNWHLYNEREIMLENINPLRTFSGEKTLVRSGEGFAIIDKNGNIIDRASTVLGLGSSMTETSRKNIYERHYSQQESRKYPGGMEYSLYSWATSISDGPYSTISISTSYPEAHDSGGFFANVQDVLLDMTVKEWAPFLRSGNKSPLQAPTLFSRYNRFQASDFTEPHEFNPSARHYWSNKDYSVFTFKPPFVTIKLFHTYNSYPFYHYEFITIFLKENDQYEKVQLHNLIDLDTGSSLIDHLFNKMADVSISELRFCPSDEGWDEIFNSYFAISTEGVHFIMPVANIGEIHAGSAEIWYNYFINDASFSISWDELKPYLKENEYTKQILERIE